MINFKSNNTAPLSKQDIIEAAVNIGVEPAAIQAVSLVEAPLGGFLTDGKPTVLYEAHIFSKYTEHRYDILYPIISSRTWNKSLYNRGGSSYDKLEIAMQLDETAALKACSWGKYQIMGFNYNILDFNSVQEYVQFIVENEKNHLLCFIKFIKETNAIKHLKTKDWYSFAVSYNGTGQASYYASKIQEAYFIAVKEGYNNIFQTTPRYKDVVIIFQEQLAKLGLYKDTIDGIWGKNSRIAMDKFVSLL
jgi:hypothetical protein